MKKILFIILIFCLTFTSVKADNSVLKSGKYFTKTIENIIPLNLFKQVGKTITNFGGKEILFGAAATSILSNGLTQDNNKNENIIETNNLVKVYAKGQINLIGIDESLAKRRALEDALYFASMKAGAEVRGFSSIDEGTNLNENFLVQPNNKILDYKILKSFKEDNNYVVEVEAVVGNLEKFDSVCSKRKVLNIKEFKGTYVINTSTPSWAYNYIDKILYKVRNHMINNQSINYVNHSEKIYDFNYANFDKSYDYMALVNGVEKVQNGDYIYIPSISLKKSKIFPKFYLANNKLNSNIAANKNFFDKDVLSFNSKVEIYNAVTNIFVTSIEKEYFIPINIDSNFEIVELFSKKDISFISNKLNDISIDMYNTISSKLFCEPIVAEIEIINNKLQIPLGQKQGLRVNQLAVLEDHNNANNITMLSISKLSNNRATLSPLNSNIKIDSFLGKEARFLE